jgi:hypothetical protein
MTPRPAEALGKAGLEVVLEAGAGAPAGYPDRDYESRGVNPAARNDPGNPIAGMPILNAGKARTMMVIKGGMSPGFAGIDNKLYYMDKTLMLFGDAKSFVTGVFKKLSAVQA